MKTTMFAKDNKKIDTAPASVKVVYKMHSLCVKEFLLSDDFLFIKNLELSCRIGTTKEEQAFPQILLATIRMELPLAKAGKSDMLGDTLDYAAVVESIRKIAASRMFTLVEGLAESIAAAALSDSKVRAVEVEIGKKVFAGIESIGAFIRRER